MATIKSNGTTFFLPAAMQLARGEDFARGMRCDVTDYRAMLARMKAIPSETCGVGPRAHVVNELEFDRPWRERAEEMGAVQS